MSDQLRQAAQALVDRWDSPAWGGSAENLKHTGEYIAELRKALATFPQPVQPTQAAADVLAERRRQIEQEGWTPAHDDEYLMRGSLARAASCYALSSLGLKVAVPGGWPWASEWWKPTTPRRDLVKAGALILAEIERLDRHAAKQGEA